MTAIPPPARINAATLPGEKTPASVAVNVMVFRASRLTLNPDPSPDGSRRQFRPEIAASLVS